MRHAHMKWVVVMALALAPAAALAQSGQVPAPRGGEPAKAAPAHEPGDAWLDDGWLALDEGDDESFWEGHMQPGGPGMGGAMGPGGHRGPGMGGRMRGGRGMHGGMGIARRFAGLDLTDSQRDKLRELHEAAMRRNVQRRADAQLARMDLHKLMRSGNPSASAVNAQIDKVARLHADGLKAHFDTYMQARALLTPEQRKQLDQGPAPVRRRQGPGSGGGSQ